MRKKNDAIGSRYRNVCVDSVNVFMFFCFMEIIDLPQLTMGMKMTIAVTLMTARKTRMLEMWK